MILPDESGKEYNLKKGLILIYCYPKDNTLGCTIESKEFSKLHEKFLDKGVLVFGLSKDTAKSHKKFASDCNLTVPLLVDTDHKMLNYLNVLIEKQSFGKKQISVERSTFLLKDGNIIREWRNVNPIGHAKKVLDNIS